MRSRRHKSRRGWRDRGLFAAFMTQVEALQTASLLIFVVTAFLALEGMKYPVARRRQAVADLDKQETVRKQGMPA
jgi:hypothetical protein